MSDFDHQKALAKAKLGKDIADAAFRLVQLYFVMALVFYFWRETGHWIGAVANMFVGAIMVLHLFNAPSAALLEFEKSYDGVPVWAVVVMWGTFILFAAMTLLLLIHSDGIVIRINDLMHPASLTQPQTGI